MQDWRVNASSGPSTRCLEPFEKGSQAGLPPPVALCKSTKAHPGPLRAAPDVMSDLIRTLNDVIATCRDSEEGFGKAAKGVHDDNLRRRFVAIARQRSDFADELTDHVRKLGGTPAQSGHQSGIQRAGWRELEERIRPKADHTFVAECERGEENTLRHYDHALTEDLPDTVRPMVERQRLAVEETLLQLRSLEQVRRAG